MGFWIVSVWQPLNIDLSTCRYRALIGTGGIGSGLFFVLDGNRTLGREESRSGRYLNQRDYCKLHIIAHYVAILLPDKFQTIPLGMVGEDDLGRQLISEMRQAGMDTRYVHACPGERTLMGFCFLYPDGTGGNLTPDSSASHRVGASFIAGAEEEFARFAGQGIALAAPEVPLEARMRLYALARSYDFLRAASFTSGELLDARTAEMLSQTDLLSINIDEAAALVGGNVSDHPAEEIAETAISRLSQLNPAMRAAVTAGRHGSWSWDGNDLHHQPALPVSVVNTAGAGDSFLSALIIAHVAGLPFCQAQELATLIAGFSTLSPHTIHPELDRHSLRAFAKQIRSPLSMAVLRLLEE
jgi:ribokinase